MLIAQISDIHARPGTTALDRLRDAANWLQALKPDVVVVTGDMVDDGWKAGYRTTSEILRSLRCPVHTLPGNADDHDLMRAELGEFFSGPGPGPLHFAATLGGIGLIGLDVTVAGQGYGDALPHLGWLEGALSASGPACLVFMHQPPIPIGIKPLDAVRCRNAEGLQSVIEAADTEVLAILCGHVHRQVSGLLGDVVVRTCGSICPANPLLLERRTVMPVTDGPSLAVHHIEGMRLLSHSVSMPA